MDTDRTEIQERLGQIRDNIISEFNIPKITDVSWEEKREEFIDAIKSVNPKVKLSEKAITLLRAAGSTSDGLITKVETISGNSLSVGTKEYITSQDRREIAGWDSAIKELVDLNLIECNDERGRFYYITQDGYNYIDKMK